MSSGIYTKDPAAVLDYSTDWSTWLSEGETISSMSWAVDGPDEALTVDSDEDSDTAPRVWLSAGTVGKNYRVTNHIVTTQGRTDERTFQVWVRER